MKVVFLAHTKLGGKSFRPGEHPLPDHIAHNLAFKKMVASGQARVLPRDAESQRIQMSQDMKAQQRARAARAAVKALQSAKATPSAPIPTSDVAGAAQPLPTPAQPILAGATAVASAPVAPVTAPKARKAKK